MVFQEYKDLAPNIYRQRLILEGLYREKLEPVLLTDYLVDLAAHINMEIAKYPEVFFSEWHGYCVYMTWITSGASIYTWEFVEPRFFSVDIYSCKSFKNEEVFDFTKQYFGSPLKDLVMKPV